MTPKLHHELSKRHIRSAKAAEYSPFVFVFCLAKPDVLSVKLYFWGSLVFEKSDSLTGNEAIRALGVRTPNVGVVIGS
ncbi:hypothetical protein D1614_16845 [Maribellus luteus]|uniref:Uncharacterized protein n=1 Tax=Maribellus luteus TaxID=2305463 RepID=A0A399SSM8_9BACT|nr:hypothetical protein D1614_16845 [Maribellus luteus]